LLVAKAIAEAVNAEPKCAAHTETGIVVNTVVVELGNVEVMAMVIASITIWTILIKDMMPLTCFTM
jgi:hypothetical protein